MNTFVVAVLSLAFLGVVRGEKRDSVVDKGDHLLICSQEPIDFGIVLDSSSSIATEDFDKAKEFLVDFMGQFDIGVEKNDVRVSIITFGLGIYPEDAFNFNTHKTKQGVLDALAKMPHHEGPYTDTGKAIHYMHYTQMAPNMVRPHAEKIALVITDGNSQRWSLTRDEASAAREDNITMFALGIGSERQVKMQELLRIAGSPDRVTRVDNFDSLDTVKQILAKKTCIRKEKPTTTPKPRAKTCGEKDPADIEFFFSPSDVGLDTTAWITSFIGITLRSEKLDEGFRYGASTGTCPDDEGFNLDTYDNVQALKDRLSQYDKMELPSLIRNEMFDEAHGGREDARDVAVIFLNGHKGLKGGEVKAKIQELKAQGVTVFVANAAGYPIDIEGAISLSGRSSLEQSKQFVSLLCPEKSAS